MEHIQILQIYVEQVWNLLQAVQTSFCTIPQVVYQTYFLYLHWLGKTNHKKQTNVESNYHRLQLNVLEKNVLCLVLGRFPSLWNLICFHYHLSKKQQHKLILNFLNYQNHNNSIYNKFRAYLVWHLEGDACIIKVWIKVIVTLFQVCHLQSWKNFYLQLWYYFWNISKLVPILIWWIWQQWWIYTVVDAARLTGWAKPGEICNFIKKVLRHRFSVNFV